MQLQVKARLLKERESAHCDCKMTEKWYIAVFCYDTRIESFEFGHANKNTDLDAQKTFLKLIFGFRKQLGKDLRWEPKKINV